MLRRRRLVVGGLDRDPHLLQVLDRPPAEVGPEVLGGEVEVAAVVQRHRRIVAGRAREQEELDLGPDLEAVALVGRRRQDPSEGLARVAGKRRAIGQARVAEHARDDRVRPPGQDLEGRRVGMEDHVALGQPGRPLQGRAVDADPALERRLELGDGNGDRLGQAEHVDEPEPDEPDSALLDRAQDEVGVRRHRPAQYPAAARPAPAEAVHPAFTRATRPGYRRRGRCRRTMRTLCPYCGTGCGLIVRAEGSRLAAVEGDPIHPVSHGRTCRKPLELAAAVHAVDRATTPLWREDRDARFEPTGWPDAFERLAAPAAGLRAGRDRLLHLGPAPDRGLLRRQQAGRRGSSRTNNLDSNSRLCMSSAVAGYKGAFGFDGPPPAYADLAVADCLLLLGSNTAACHPILWSRIRERQAEGAFVICVDPRPTPTAEAADLHLAVRPGTDLALLNAMLAHDRPRRPARPGLHRPAHDAASRRPRGGRAPSGRPGRAAEVCGIAAADIELGRPALRRRRRGDGPVVDGRQPVDGRDAEESGADQPLPGHRADRAPRGRPPVADRPAERDGRARGRRPRPPPARLSRGRRRGRPRGPRGPLVDARPDRPAAGADRHRHLRRRAGSR